MFKIHLKEGFLKIDKKIFFFICIFFYLRRWILMDRIHNSDLVFISVGPNFRLFKS